MPLEEDDDDVTNYRFRRPDDEDPDDSDSAPDDVDRVKCQFCGKWILEDFPKCPYCRAWQSDRTRKSWLFRITAIVCILMATGWALSMCQGIVP